MRVPMKVNQIVIFLFFIFLSPFVHAQQILFRNYTVADGLCANTVWTISQDNKGYLWFGTKNGLNRFDGYQFKTYRFNKEKPKSLGNNWVKTIFNYNADSCWIGTEKGIYILDLPHEQFHFFKKIGKRTIFDIKRDSSGKIWIATNDGVFSYFPKTQKIHHFLHHKGNPNSLSMDYVKRLAIDSSGQIWMGTAWKGIDVYNPKEQTFIHYKATGKEGSLSSNFITDLYKDKQGNIWVGTEKGGLNLWNPHTQTFKVYKHTNTNSISDNIIRDIYQPHADKLYIGTEGGLDILDLHSGKFTNYHYQANDPHSLSDNAVYDIFQDHSGGIWIGTYFGGVNYFHPRHTTFELYYPTGSEKSLSGKAVSAMLQADSTHIWVGTEDGGLNYFNTRTKTFQHYPFKAKQESLSYHNIHTLIKDRKGNLWIGTFTGGINVYHPETGKVKVFKFGKEMGDSSNTNMIYALHQDQQGIIWIGTVGGLFKYLPEKKKFIKVNKLLLGQIWVYDIYEDHNGHLWVGSYNQGLYEKDPKNNRWHHYKIARASDSSHSEKIISIQEGNKHKLWLGTDEGGLYLFNTKTKKSTSFKNKYGLNADIVYGILKDKEGHLWLSTNNGIFDFNPEDTTSIHYTQWDHLQGKQFNYKSYLKTRDGKLYFGGIKGLNAFYPDSIHHYKTKPHIIFTNFQLFNQDIPTNTKKSPLTRTISYTNKLTLSHKQSMFSIEYAALDYIAPNKTQYAYKMKGYDPVWNKVNGQRKATYTNLPAGDYTFQVKATDLDGNWSPPSEIAITIRPPFYRTTAAYIFYVLIFLSIIYWLRRMEIKKIERKNKIKLERAQVKKEHAFYKQKIDFFTSMAHEIRTPLSLIIAPLEKLIQSNHWRPKSKEQLTIMEDNANRLLMLTNQLLDFRKMESDVYEIQQEKIEIVSLVQQIFSRFSSISYKKGIKYSISSHLKSQEIEADPEALTKILSNLLINAFKFTRSRVEVRINKPYTHKEKHYFSISIEDDGIGIPKKEISEVFKKFYQVSSGAHEYHNLGGNGIGLALAKSLTEKHEGSLSIESEENIKTIFTVHLPFTPAKEKPSSTILSKEETAEETDKQYAMIVEDDVSLLDFISKNMEDEGFAVIKAKNGKDALQQLEREDIKIIISDVMMPEMDGLALCQRIKENTNYSHIPVILLTARTNMEVEIEGIENGADAYITKPFKWKHVMAVVNNLLTSREQLKQKFSQYPFEDPGSLVTNTGDKKFINQVTELIMAHLDDPQFSVTELSNELAMSRSNLHKKLKAISGHVPNKFIRLIRLKHAAKLLLQKEYSIAEIGYMTGFNSPSYFSKCFNLQFKLSPKEFIKKEIQKSNP